MDRAQAAALKEARRRLTLKRRLVLLSLSSKEDAPERLWREFHGLSREIFDIDRELGIPRMLVTPPPRGHDDGSTAASD
jgi:hypothetical protein